MPKVKVLTEPGVLQRMAHLLGTELKNHRLDIPEKFGAGYCAGFVFNKHIRMLVLNYELKEDLVIENPDVRTAARTILFKFQDIFPATEVLTAEKQLRTSPSVLIATAILGPNVLIPVHSHTATINIEVDADYLSGLFDRSEWSPVLHGLLRHTQPLLFEQMIYPSLQKIVDEIVAGPASGTFQLFFLRVKAEELVCRLLMELEKREERQLYPLNNQDIAAIYRIKDQMLLHPETAPAIGELARSAGMSPTKLKRIFRQIFGNSIFNYYQALRMNEAARLLKEEQLSVAAAGYQMGFTNLSHFSRVFERHMGLKPKKYTAANILSGQ